MRLGYAALTSSPSLHSSFPHLPFALSPLPPFASNPFIPYDHVSVSATQLFLPSTFSSSLPCGFASAPLFIINCVRPPLTASTLTTLNLILPISLTTAKFVAIHPYPLCPMWSCIRFCHSPLPHSYSTPISLTPLHMILFSSKIVSIHLYPLSPMQSWKPIPPLFSSS